MQRTFIFILNLICFTNLLFGQNKSFDLSINLSFDPALSGSFKPEGRLLVFISQSPFGEPMDNTWPEPGSGTAIFAKNLSNVSAAKVLKLKSKDHWMKTGNWSFDKMPEGEYFIQVLWDQDTEESRTDAPGNLYSKNQKIVVNKSLVLDITINQVIAPRTIDKHTLVKEVNFKSDTLSAWWKKPMYLKASILLPKDYDKSKAYPIRYNVAGYGGRYTRINYLLKNKTFMTWWESGDAPAVINVFLDGEGPFGDSYQMDSDNSGPYGHALIHELIPYIETTYRGSDKAETRFVDGCSTGGWVSLGLQLYYPDFFNGAFSYSPDAVEFENYQLTNIYKDKNLFVNEFGYERPIMRFTDGEPAISTRDFIQYENVLGSADSYLNSGGQFSAHTALYSPKGDNGLPKPLFDPQTGEIDHAVAEHWKKYDFKVHAANNWATLGPKLQGKLFIWMGDMDNFYLNPATRAFGSFLKSTKNPTSDAELIFSPMEGHCTQYSHKEVLMQIQKRLEEIGK